MAGFAEAFRASIRSGSWLTRERMRLVALAVLAASVAALGFVFATADGFIDRFGHTLGTDFSSFYAAGTLVRDGMAGAAYDLTAHFARERALFGPATPFYSFLYPPYFLFVAAPLALLPYLPALAVWQGATLILYLVAIRAALGTAATGSLWLLLAAAFPAVFVNIGHGQNGLLTAALFGGALVCLERRPVAAGILFGLLVYKPQFGLLIPIALLAGGHWRTIASAAATVTVLTLATTWAFGLSIWQAFNAAAPFARTVLLEQGDVGWHKLQSVFAWVRMWGGPVGLAYALQVATAIAVAAAVAWLWRGRISFASKAAVLPIGTLLATPFSLDYDLMLLAPAIAFLAAGGLRAGFAPWEKTLLAALWLVPLIARSVAGAALIPLAVPAMLAVFILVLHRAMQGRDAEGGGDVLRAAP